MVKANIRNGRFNVDRSMATVALANAASWLSGFTPPGVRNPDAVIPLLSYRARWNATNHVTRTLLRMLEAMPAVALLLDPAGNIAWTNSRATRLLGYAPDEIVGIPIECVLLLPARDDGPASLSRPTRDEWPLHGDSRVAIALTKRGADLEVRVTTSVLPFRPESAIVLVIEPDTPGAVVDASARRRLHQERVSEMADMTAALAHEINQPLTAILSNAQAAQRFLAQNPPAMSDLQELLAEIVSDSARANAVIRKMRQSTRREPPELGAIDVSGFVHEVVRLLRRETESAGATVAVRIEDPLPQLLGDAVRLQQVLVNLLLNALDAVRDCDTASRKVCVAVTATADRSKVHIAILDQGPGIDAGRFATLFRPFVTSKPGGMGLGLSISRTIVIAHGGKLWAEHNSNRGMTFHIELPALDMSAKTHV